jgi:hypothetical protein
MNGRPIPCLLKNTYNFQYKIKKALIRCNMENTKFHVGSEVLMAG